MQPIAPRSFVQFQRVFGAKKSSTAPRVRRNVGRLADQMTEFGVGSLPEAYYGMPPHTPDGCIAQAWSVAEALRVWKMLSS